jgi:hypothetical protein
MDRISGFVKAAKDLDEATFVQRYKTSFLVFPKSTEELTTEVALRTELPMDAITAVFKAPGSIDESALIDLGFFLEPIAGRWPGEFGDVVTVGRARGNDIYIADPTVSKLHAYFRRDEEGVIWLFDPGSRNGTFVGSVRMRMGTQHKLGESEVVSFGGIRALFKQPAALQKFLRKVPTPAKGEGNLPKPAK